MIQIERNDQVVAGDKGFFPDQEFANIAQIKAWLLITKTLNS
jgi:hypothetical protein